MCCILVLSVLAPCSAPCRRKYAEGQMDDAEDSVRLKTGVGEWKKKCQRPIAMLWLLCSGILRWDALSGVMLRPLLQQCLHEWDTSAATCVQDSPHHAGVLLLTSELTSICRDAQSSAVFLFLDFLWCCVTGWTPSKKRWNYWIRKFCSSSCHSLMPRFRSELNPFHFISEHDPRWSINLTYEKPRGLMYWTWGLNLTPNEWTVNYKQKIR